MRQVLEELHSLLIEQKSILTDMLALSEEERRIIISGEADKLEDVVRKEMRLLSKLNAIEKKRMAMNPAVSAEFDLPIKEITVTSIAARAKPDEREVITSLQKELSALLGRHTELNNENRELIKAHIEYTDAVMDIMVDSEDPLNNFYGGDGKAMQDKKKSTGFFNGTA